MKAITILFLLVPLFIACGQGDQDVQDTVEPAAQVAHADKDKGCHDGETCNEVAVFSVEGLDMNMAGSLVKALAELPGVLKAKPAVADGKFAVEFTNPTSTPKTLLAAMKDAGASAILLDVTPAEAGSGEKSGCAGCPSQAKCQDKS